MPTTLASATHAELLIKKSRFIACVQPCASRDEAVAVVRGLKAQHPGAAHVCWALMAGGQSAAVDDGEPSGTAGRAAPTCIWYCVPVGFWSAVGLD